MFITYLVFFTRIKRLDNKNVYICTLIKTPNNQVSFSMSYIWLPKVFKRKVIKKYNNSNHFIYQNYVRKPSTCNMLEIHFVGPNLHWKSKL